MNNQERELWILNDEGLYLWWQDSGQSNRNFINDNREEIDQYINRAINKEPKR